MAAVWRAPVVSGSPSPGRISGRGLPRGAVRLAQDLESDPAWNTFADDAAPTLHALHDVGPHIAVVSDIHVDIRPSFAAAGLERLVDGAAVELGW